MFLKTDAECVNNSLAALSITWWCEGYKVFHLTPIAVSLLEEQWPVLSNVLLKLPVSTDSDCVMHIDKNIDTSVVATVYSHARIVFMRTHAHAELRALNKPL